MPLPSERATEVVQNRQETYGHPGPIYDFVAEMWNLWLGVEGTEEVIRTIDSTDVAMMLALMKIGRQRMKKNDDNLTDVCGYMNVYEMVRDYES